MQLILDPDNGINFNPKMAALDAESLSEKTNTNGLIQKLNDNKENLENMYDKEKNTSEALTLQSTELTTDIKIHEMNTNLANNDSVRLEEEEERVNLMPENRNEINNICETKEKESCDSNSDDQSMQKQTNTLEEPKASKLKTIDSEQNESCNILSNEDKLEAVNGIQECVYNTDDNTSPLDTTKIYETTNEEQKDFVETITDIELKTMETINDIQECLKNKNDDSLAPFKKDIESIGNNIADTDSNEIKNKEQVVTKGVVSEKTPALKIKENNVIQLNETVLNKNTEIINKMDVDEIPEHSPKETNSKSDVVMDSEIQSKIAIENETEPTQSTIDQSETLLSETDVNRKDESEVIISESVVVEEIAPETLSVEKEQKTDVENKIEDKQQDCIALEENNLKNDLTDTEKREEEAQQPKSNGDTNTVKDIGDTSVMENIVNSDTQAVDIATDLSSQLEASNVSKQLEDSHKENIPLEKQDTVTNIQDNETKILPEQIAVEESKSSVFPETSRKLLCSKLSNNLDILSDEDDDTLRPTAPLPLPPPSEVKCINLDDDDDCMLIDEDSSPSETKTSEPANVNKTEVNNLDSDGVEEKCESESAEKPADDAETVKKANDANVEITSSEEIAPTVSEKQPEETVEDKKDKPLIPKDFLKLCTKKLCDMTRDDLEEFCVLKIAEAVIDRNKLYDMKAKIKTMYQSIEEYKKKSGALAKQNRDLQVVLKSVQEEQKKKTNAPITPLKITRSVGVQVVMADKPVRRKIGPGQILTNATVPNTPMKRKRSNSGVQKNQINRQSSGTTGTNQQIPVPRLVPAQNAAKVVNIPSNQKASPNNMPNGARKSPSISQKVEKRPLSRQSSTSSVTVDLTDDEPPAKIRPAQPPVRLVNQQSLMAPRMPNSQTVNSPRKVFIPISSSQADGLRVGQKIMLRGVKPPDQNAVIPQQIRTPSPKVVRLPSNNVRLPRVNTNSRHPAPLPDPVKQYQPPTWKGLPPAPDLKLSKVENGIVISWKIDGYLEDKCEKIASYQLYAYQETTGPPSTSLWKKIGDVKALPLPMACTLTQFMAGYKYYFAVRAVDVRSRVGPFSLPGSILLLNKV